MQRDVERLENYIKDIIYQPEQAELDYTCLEKENQSLGMWIQKLGTWITEVRQYAEAVAAGTAHAAVPPSEDNIFGESIKSIQDRFSRMTGQIQMVVGQNKSLVEPEDTPPQSFDDMVLELQKRTSALENERNLFVKFTESASERIIVLDETSGEMVYANRIARRFFEQTKNYIDSADDINQLSGCSYQNTYNQWLHTVKHPGAAGEEIIEYYQVHSLYIIWEGSGAIAHMFTNVTGLKEAERLAKKDYLTGTYNRAYAMEHIEELHKLDKAFSLAFVDVDYLKYCNDTFGHSAGDEYLRQVVELLNQVESQAVVCRLGGDEFMVITEILEGERLRERIEEVRGKLGLEMFPKSKIHKSFSYGIAARETGDPITVKKLLSDADERMYQNKLENKKTNHMEIVDDRLG